MSTWLLVRLLGMLGLVSGLALLIRFLLKRSFPMAWSTWASRAFVATSTAGAQTLTREQRKCIDGMHRAAARVAKTQTKQSLRCIKSVLKGKIAPGEADACEAADAAA